MKNSGKCVLIVSDSFDELTNDTISFLLNSKNEIDFIRLNVDNLKITKDNFGIINNKLLVNNQVISFIWFRRHKLFLDFNENHLSNINTILYSAYFIYKEKGRTLSSPIIFKKHNRIYLNYIIEMFGLNYLTCQFSSISEDFDFSAEKYIIKNLGVIQTIINDRGERVESYNRLISPSDIQLGAVFYQKYLKTEFEMRGLFILNTHYAIAKFFVPKTSPVIDIRTAKNLRMVPVKIPSKIQKQLNLVFEKLDIDFCTYDLLFKDKKYYLVDVNPMGVCTDIYKFGNFNLPEIIFNHLLKIDSWKALILMMLLPNQLSLK